MRSKDIAIVGICLAAGAILRFVANMFPGAIVGNPVIALYCLALILVRPALKEAIGIGLVAAVVSMLISHSIFPPANLISEPLGAIVCVILFALLAGNKDKSREPTKLAPVAPAITTFMVAKVIIVNEEDVSRVIFNEIIMRKPNKKIASEILDTVI